MVITPQQRSLNGLTGSGVNAQSGGACRDNAVSTLSDKLIGSAWVGSAPPAEKSRPAVNKPA